MSRYGTLSGPSGVFSWIAPSPTEPICVGDALDRLVACEAGQLDVADADARQDPTRVLLVVGVERTRTQGQRGDQADEEGDAEAQRSARPGLAGREFLGFGHFGAQS